MMNIKNKKGSQVAIILSIVIFIGFFIFLYIILIPKVAVENNKDIVMNLLNYRLTDELSANLTTVTLVLIDGYSVPGGHNCLDVANPYGDGSLNFFARDYNNPLASSFDSTNIQIGANTNSKFFKIYYSEELFGQTVLEGTCHNPILDQDYKIGLIKTTEEVFESKILNYITIYNEDYGDLKAQLGLSTGKEFYFNFTYANGTSISPIEKSTYGSLYVQRKYIEYIDMEANKKIGVLEIWVW